MRAGLTKARVGQQGALVCAKTRQQIFNKGLKTWIQADFGQHGIHGLLQSILQVALHRGLGYGGALPVALFNFITVDQDQLPDPEFGHALYKCLWYWYEIEARVQHYRTTYPELRWADLKTEELNEKSALARMFGEIGVQFDEQKLDQLVGNRSNLKKERKQQAVDWNEAEKMHIRLREKIEERYDVFATGQKPGD